MNRFAVLVAMLLALAAVAVEAQQRKTNSGLTKDPRILAYDKGPAKIDVSKYPDDIRPKYKTFTTLCSKCHTIARAINSDYVLDEEWQQYIRQMMDKGGSLISADDAKSIYTFLTYDSKIRKKSLYDKKTAAGSK